MQYLDHYESPIGKMTMAIKEDNLIGLWFDKQKYFGLGLDDPYEKETPTSKKVKEWLDIYFKGKEPKFSIPISYANPSSFAQKVHEILLRIPYGKTVTYKDIALMIESETCKKASPQAIGGAVSHNPISIIVPCHRVIGTNGRLTGYASGVEKKRYLLELEGVKVFD